MSVLLFVVIFRRYSGEVQSSAKHNASTKQKANLAARLLNVIAGFSDGETYLSLISL
jgi:hypothetical protein